MKQPKRKSKVAPWPRMNRKVIQVLSSFEESDRLDDEYWASVTPAARLRALEKLRQMNYGYGQGRPRPQFQRVLKIIKLGQS